jgi:hypothetical protein
VRWLRDRGLEAQAVQTRFEGERDDEVSDEAGPLSGGEAVADEAVL